MLEILDYNFLYNYAGIGRLPKSFLKTMKFILTQLEKILLFYSCCVATKFTDRLHVNKSLGFGCFIRSITLQYGVIYWSWFSLLGEILQLTAFSIAKHTMYRLKVQCRMKV